MRVKVLGSAAGGGFPQWNCACPNCRRLRQGTLRGKARTQAQIAITANGEAWYMLNASPDLRVQVEGTPELQPKREPRDTPIAGVVLTSGDLDHVLGLLLLREFQPMCVYGTPSLRKLLTEENAVFRMLFSGQRGFEWRDLLPGQKTELCDVAGRKSGVIVEPIPLFGNYPRYHDRRIVPMFPSDEAVLGVAIQTRDEQGNPAPRRMIYAPGLAQLDETTLHAFDTADLLFVDGTFWSEDELCAAAGRTASDMGHLPISGASGTLKELAELKTPRKIFIHINNTNPILDEDSLEHQQVRGAGWEIAEDGMEFEL
jgi:pyrroloquinoline quinone biosynthesis protein B